MRRYRVEILRRAEDDLLNLYETFANQSGIAVAGDYIDRIEAACLALETSPLRGTRRDDILPGLRTIGFERRATIVFRVRRSKVSVMRIFYGGQDFEGAMRSQ
jgi:toxin ParE1/3/4